MNSYLYNDGSDADCQQSCQLHTKKSIDQEYWDEHFEIQQDLANQGFHK